MARRHLRQQVTDPAVREALTPTYRMGCKRILISNDYLPTFNRPDVYAGHRTPPPPFEADAVVTADGARHLIDTLVLSTGFKATDPYDRLTVTGPGGRTLREAWSAGMQAHLGVTVAGFPNLFLVVGPNSGLGHNSMVFVIEAQTRYLAQCIRLRDQAGARSVSVPQRVQDSFNAELERAPHTPSGPAAAAAGTSTGSATTAPSGRRPACRLLAPDPPGRPRARPAGRRRAGRGAAPAHPAHEEVPA